MSEFRGFKREAIQFLADLAANNARTWFQARKTDYEQLLKEPMEQLCEALSERFAERGVPLQADPRTSVFRIYRDTRFSKDKSPYKTHLAASFPLRSTKKQMHGDGAYFHFQPGEMFMGGGMWRADKPRLDAFRAALMKKPSKVRAAFEDPGFVKAFKGVKTEDALKRMPPGYPADHPMADMFRWKDVIFGKRLSDAQVLSAKLPGTLADSYAAALPVLKFLATLG